MQLMFRGFLKAFILAPIASLLFTLYLFNKLYRPTYNLNYHLLGTAPEFFLVALSFTTIYSLSGSMLTCAS